MKNTLTYKVAFGCIMALMCLPLSAQNDKTSAKSSQEVYEANKRLDNYQELKNLGYQDREIFEDLGNANFLLENYETALFWYNKLKDISKNGILSDSYDERCQFALANLGQQVTFNRSQNKDWLSEIQTDYQINRNESKSRQGDAVATRFKALDMSQINEQFLDDQLALDNSFEPLDSDPPETENGYKAPITVTADGNTAYFSKAIYVKPEYGIFSKKELVHKIYRAEKRNGQWMNIQEVALCPKNYSTLHPAISEDGSRLFFASDMPGTFGKYDIYVARVNKDGSLGIAKNLGQKVNTKKNDLYPTIVGSSALFFASEGRKGYGGLDVYMAEVGQKKVGLAVNLGNPINSAEDDFSISLITEKGMGYVMSNRGKTGGAIQQVAFSYPNKEQARILAKREYNILEVLNKDLKIDYTSSVFEDE